MIEPVVLLLWAMVAQQGESAWLSDSLSKRKGPAISGPVPSDPRTSHEVSHPNDSTTSQDCHLGTKPLKHEGSCQAVVVHAFDPNTQEAESGKYL